MGLSMEVIWAKVARLEVQAQQLLLSVPVAGGCPGWVAALGSDYCSSSHRACQCVHVDTDL